MGGFLAFDNPLNFKSIGIDTSSATSFLRRVARVGIETWVRSCFLETVFARNKENIE